MVRFVIVFSEQINALGISGAVMATTDEPSGGLGGLIAAPDAGPKWVADGLPIPTRLVAVGPEVGAGGHAAIGACFLLEVGEGQAERDERMQLALRSVLGGLSQLGLNAQECCKNDDHHHHHRHDGKGENEAEAASRRGVG